MRVRLERSPAYQSLEKPNMYGSLVFGGYDQTRFEPNNVTFPFDANDSRKPSLNIQSIVTQNAENTTVSMLPDGPVYSLIDFAEPQMWLPVSACDAFAKAFNLTYDNSTDLYLIDETTRSRLLNRNPSITFGLGKTANPGERVNVVLPYSAFDQQASYPVYANATNYFPIRRAYNDTQYTIGRTFFQEAYFRIDYDRGNFSVHQALFPATNNNQDIVPVSSPDLINASLQSEGHQNKILNKATIAGISIGSVAVVTLLFLFLSWLLRRRKRAAKDVKAVLDEKKIDVEVADQPKVETEGVALYEKDSRLFVETDGSALHELHSPQEAPKEMDGGQTETNLSTVIEVYEMEDTGRIDLPDPDFKVSLSSRPPPGWI
jgi:hypothetical protein